VLGKGQDRRNTDSQMEATNVKDLRILNKPPDFGRFEVLELIMVGRSQVGNHGTVVTSNHDTATTSGVLLVDSILSAKSLALAGFAELTGICILTDTSDVDGRVGGKNVLPSTY